jgi:hypothetical protein
MRDFDLNLLERFDWSRIVRSYASQDSYGSSKSILIYRKSSIKYRQLVCLLMLNFYRKLGRTLPSTVYYATSISLFCNEYASLQNICPTFEETTVAVSVLVLSADCETSESHIATSYWLIEYRFDEASPY